jgi:hypothetical protein
LALLFFISIVRNTTKQSRPLSFQINPQITQIALIIYPQITQISADFFYRLKILQDIRELWRGNSQGTRFNFESP